MARDPELLRHQQWLGYLQPVGLVVSPPALLQCGAHVDSNIIAQHERFLEHVADKLVVGQTEPTKAVTDLAAFLKDVCGWRASDLVAADDPRAEALEADLTNYQETLRPSYAVPEDSTENPLKWLLLIQELPLGTPLDEMTADERHWQATPQARFERLLRETKVPIGLLSNGTHLRLVYAPPSESSGHLTFPVIAMIDVAGRPIFAALLMLLSEQRLFSLPDKQRLPSLLAESRKYQNTVSTELAQQVLAALFELLRGFQAADDLRKNELLKDVLARDPDQVYAGLLTVLLRLVFLLYAEDRGLMSDDEVYVKHYSVTGLFERLRTDAGHYPDTMNQRYGAWAQLLTLFRMVHDGGRHGKLRLPPRHGYLFNSDRYPFLEGRRLGSQREPGQRTTPPLVSDGVLFRVLHNLLMLDGERISYRSLDVEQIGSVYETIMGFRLETAKGRSIAVKPAKAHGAPTTINLEELLNVPAKDRAKWLKEHADQAVTAKALIALKAADTPEALVGALDRKVAKELTPSIVSAGCMVLQPSDERRRSGSHYTPRSLTEPIVRKTLEPILKNLGDSPTPQQILDLKVCDPAMGSAAFLVETCRQLGDVLVKAWHVHNQVPRIPLDEDEILHARRLIAQRCLYGVDKNAMAVDLAKLSLWLATLAKDHPFTFLDHALRHGDSLVGLTRRQIADFHWLPTPGRVFGQQIIEERIQAATRVRQEIIEAGDEVPFLLKQQKLALADQSLNLVRFAGNLVIAAFFAGGNDKERKLKREELLQPFTESLRTGIRPPEISKAEQALRSGDKAIHPFHWEIEFPEVFGRENGGFDAMVGNPPFLGGKRISTNFGDSYRDWLAAMHDGTNSNADMVAHFFRRAFGLLREGRTFGLIATNSVAQGDTRATGLRWICTHNGTIYCARRRYKWPGQAAVIVSVIHIAKGALAGPYDLDGVPAPLITAYLFHAGTHEDPEMLEANANKSFIGSIILGMGFTFDDTDGEGVASPIAEMQRMIERNKQNADRIFPFIGGEEVNESPTHSHRRYVINFGEMTERDANRWPDLMAILRERVKPEREKKSKEIAQWPWWQFWRARAELYRAIHGLEQALVVSRVSQYFGFVFLPSNQVYSDRLVVFPLAAFTSFATMQSRVHDLWAIFFGTTHVDRPTYAPERCFETFPFAEKFETDAKLEAVGKEYYEFRAALMVQNNEGLTKTYNRFHDPHETSAEIKKLREMHAAMDRAVLDAYGWTDLQPTCEFLLDYEEEEEDEDDAGKARRRKKPWRYRWPDDFRDEVLARLLELNKKRAEAERLAGAAARAAEKPKAGKAKKKQKGQGEMF